MLRVRMNPRSQDTICTNVKFQCCRNDIDFYSSVFSPVVPVTTVDVIPTEPENVLPLGLKDYSRLQTCAVDGCDLPAQKPGNSPSASVCLHVHKQLHTTTSVSHHIVSSTDYDMFYGGIADSLDSCPPTMLMASTSTECSQGNGITGICTDNFHRSISEPQEDEWCGT